MGTEKEHTVYRESDDKRVMTHPRLLLMEEYKLLQAKIDKLGEDKFKVRSWCFTIVTGVLAGAKLSGALADFGSGVFLLVLFVPTVIAFHLVELRQRQIANRFGVRAQLVERLLRHNLAQSGDASTLAPGLASYMIREGIAERVRCSIWQWCLRKVHAKKIPVDTAAPRRRGRPKRSFEPAPLLDCLTTRADTLFYVAQYLIILFSLVGLIAYRIWFSTAPSRPDSALVLRVNTNEFRFFVGQTNIVVTNFTEVVRLTTNFQIVNLLSTNYIPTNVFVTNTLPVGGPK